MANMQKSYNFENKYRGRALIIANENFTAEGFSLRPGAVEDMKMMKILFKALDFNVKCCKDMSAYQMMAVIDYAAKEKENAESDCFVLVISSHGSNEKSSKGENLPRNAQLVKHCIRGVDGSMVFTHEILGLFDDQRATGLAGKPKLFFLQACRSSDGSTPYDYGKMIKILTFKPLAKDDCFGTPVADNASDSKKTPIGLSNDQIDEYEDIYTNWTEESTNNDWKHHDWHESQSATDTKENLDSASNQDSQSMKPIDKSDAGGAGDGGSPPPVPFELVPDLCHKDCLIMYPVVSGKFAFTNTKYGSYLFKYMYECMDEIMKNASLLKYLTSVCHKMSKYEYNPQKIPHDMTPEEEKNLPFKMCASIVHRLTGDVRLEPKNVRSCMAIARRL